MADKELPSPELLRKLLRYEPETGRLFWRERDRKYFKTNGSYKTWNQRFAKTEAFIQRHNQGYLSGTVCGKNLLTHRVIWAMQTSDWPSYEIDHIDGNRKNNKWKNLRSATATENVSNRCSSKNSTSVYLGVNWHKVAQKWIVRIRKDKHQRYLGIFDCEIKAAKAYDEAAQKIHGEFARLNFPDC